MKSRYQMFAGYNAWCNERLYAAAAKLTEADYRAAARTRASAAMSNR